MTHTIEVTYNENPAIKFDDAQYRIRSDGNLEIYEVNTDGTQTFIAVFKNWDSVIRVEAPEKVVEENYATEYEEAQSSVDTSKKEDPEVRRSVIRKTRGTK